MGTQRELATSQESENEAYPLARWSRANSLWVFDLVKPEFESWFTNLLIQ